MVNTGNNMSTAALTMQEIDDMLDEAEAAFEAGDYLTNDEVFHDHEETVAVISNRPRDLF